MKMDKELLKRKSTRLKNLDYSSAGAYFVTICARDRMHILSEIVKTDFTATDKKRDIKNAINLKQNQKRSNIYD